MCNSSGSADPTTCAASWSGLAGTWSRSLPSAALLHLFVQVPTLHSVCDRSIKSKTCLIRDSKCEVFASRTVSSLEAVVAVKHAGRVGLELVHAVGVDALDLPVGDAVGSVRRNVVTAERRAICRRVGEV